jgi:hypothetical protein
MSKTIFPRLLLTATAVLSAGQCYAQSELQVRARQLPGWDQRQREGRCEIRVWVDDRADVRLRGDRIWVTTVQGAKGRDEGSECSQALPFNAVRDFQIRQTAGRSRVTMAQDPSRANNYTAMFSVEDRQGGGDNYVFEVTWHADTDVTNVPAPFFDDVRACQDAVRQRFLAQNGRGSYIDFESFADRQGGSMSRSQGQGRDRGQGWRDQDRNQGRDQERIQGRGTAKSRSETREITYSCVVDTQRNLVQSGNYNYSGESVRMDSRNPLK